MLARPRGKTAWACLQTRRFGRGVALRCAPEVPPMLELRPNCECCDRDLPPAADAMICTFECTFCPACAEGTFGGTCPNCGGGFAPRPGRPASLLGKYPASTQRVTKAHAGCSGSLA